MLLPRSCITAYKACRSTARRVSRVAAVPAAPSLRCPLRHAQGRSPTSLHFSTAAQAPEYKWINGVERLDLYAEGGYHPVEIGHVLDHRYRVVGKLGYGGWSTVWLARDERLGGYVALKVGVAESLPHEVETLRALRAENDQPCAGADAIPRILAEFRVEGPNGSHPCYTTPVALGDLRQTSFSRLFTLPVARALAFELATAVKYVHARGYAHGDIYLDNILIRAPPAFHEMTTEQFRRQYGEPELCPVERVDNGLLPPGVPSSVVTSLHMCKHAKEFTLADARLCLTDFGESFAPALGARLGSDCHTPLDFRPPEALLAPDTPLSFSSDIWSLATAIWDIIGMKALFSSFFCSQDEFILRLEDTIGPLPAEWLARWDARADYLYETGERKPGGKKPWWSLEEAFARGVQKDRRELGMGEFGTDEEAAILALMRSMLRFRPEDRKTIDEVLESEWMVKWARPEYKRSREV